MERSEWALGIDLGGTKINVSAVNDSGKVEKSVLLKTRVKEGAQAVIEDVIGAIADVRVHMKRDPCGAGVGIAAQIEKQTGRVLFAPNLGWKEFPLQEELHRRLQLPVLITNDVRAATLGEWLYGAGQGCKDLLCIFLGTGIGGGIINDGRIMDGNTNTAGEIGHMTIEVHGPNCSCGNRGCFEAIASGWAIARRAKEILAYDPSGGHQLLEMVAGKGDAITAKNVIEAYRQGDLVAKKIFEEVKEALIAGVTGLVNVLNPAKIVLGGGIISGLPELIDILKQSIPLTALKAATRSLQIVEAQLKNEAGVIGAAALMLQAYKKGE